MKCSTRMVQGFCCLFALCLLLAAPQMTEAAGIIAPGAKIVVAPFDYIGKGGSDDEMRRQFAMVADVTTTGLMSRDDDCEVYYLEEADITQKAQASGLRPKAAAKQLAIDQGADYLIRGKLVQISDDYSSTTIMIHSTVTQTFNVTVNLEVINPRTNALVASVDGKGKGSTKDSYNELLAVAQFVMAAKSNDTGSLADGVTHITQTEKGMMHAVNVATYNASEDAVNQLFGRTTDETKK